MLRKIHKLAELYMNTKISLKPEMVGFPPIIHFLYIGLKN